MASHFVAAILQLEYACTGGEIQEAESLGLRKQLGGGSKWLTWLVLLLMLVFALAAFQFQIVHQVPAAYRPYVWIGLIALFIFFFLRNRQRHNRPHATTKIELTETELTIVGPDSRVAMPWSAFGDCWESQNLFVLLDRPKQISLIVPKRSFPNDGWQTWFRQCVDIHLRSPAKARLDTLPSKPQSRSVGDVAVMFQLGYRDYLDRTIASWRTWVIIFCVISLFSGCFIYAAMNPPPHPVNSTSKVLFMFVLPFMLIMSVFVIFLISIYTWRMHAKYLIPQEWVFSGESMASTCNDSHGILPWTTYTCYKETRRSFILWNPRNAMWLLLPKRAFASIDDLTRCRTLLSNRLRQSRWFFG